LAPVLVRVVLQKKN